MCLVRARSQDERRIAIALMFEIKPLTHEIVLGAFQFSIWIGSAIQNRKSAIENRKW
jgi:hypothetical protein